MTTKTYVILSLAVLTLSLHAAESTNRLHFPAGGFSIAPLEAPSGQAGQVLIMSLPATDGFAPNVNVQIQPYKGTIEGYTAITLKQFKEIGLKVVQQKTVGTSAVIFDYTGEMGGKSVHWYSRAEKSATGVYLVTATTTEQQWAKQSPQLKACVDSFRFDNGK